MNYNNNALLSKRSDDSCAEAIFLWHRYITNMATKAVATRLRRPQKMRNALSWPKLSYLNYIKRISAEHCERFLQTHVLKILL